MDKSQFFETKKCMLNFRNMFLNLLFHLQFIKTNNIFATVNGIMIQDSTFGFEATFGISAQDAKDEAISNVSYIENPANNKPKQVSLTWIDNDIKLTSNGMRDKKFL